MAVAGGVAVAMVPGVGQPASLCFGSRAGAHAGPIAQQRTAQLSRAQRGLAGHEAAQHGATHLSRQDAAQERTKQIGRV